MTCLITSESTRNNLQIIFNPFIIQFSNNIFRWQSLSHFIWYTSFILIHLILRHVIISEYKKITTNDILYWWLSLNPTHSLTHPLTHSLTHSATNILSFHYGNHFFVDQLLCEDYRCSSSVKKVMFILNSHLYFISSINIIVIKF